VRDRVEWRWLTGPGAGDDIESTGERIEAHFADRAARLAGRRAKVMHLRAEGWTRPEIAAELGISAHTVKKDIDVSRNGNPDRGRPGARRLLRGDPELADRQIAAKLGRVDRQAIRAARHELEAAGEIPVITRQDGGKPVNHGYQPRPAT
jgi:hypothetical protein